MSSIEPGPGMSSSSLQKLKTVCFGGPGLVPEPHWLEAGIVLHQPEKLFAFGLKTSHGAQKAFQIILQAFVLKHLFFGGNKSRGGRGGYKSRTIKGKPVPM